MLGTLYITRIGEARTYAGRVTDSEVGSNVSFSCEQTVISYSASDRSKTVTLCCPGRIFALNHLCHSNSSRSVLFMCTIEELAGLPATRDRVIATRVVVCCVSIVSMHGGGRGAKLYGHACEITDRSTTNMVRRDGPRCDPAASMPAAASWQGRT